MKRWIVGGAIALGLMAAALTVPVRDGGTVTTPVTEVAAEEGVCGQITAAGDLELTRTVPLIDLGLLMGVEAALVAPRLQIATSDACDDVDQLSGGAILSHPRCANPNEMTAPESEAFESARTEVDSDAVVLCDGAGVALIAQTPLDGPPETRASWSDDRYELGRGLVMNEPYWCLKTEYWIEVHSSTASSADVTGRALEPVVMTMCVDLVNS